MVVSCEAPDSTIRPRRSKPEMARPASLAFGLYRLSDLEPGTLPIVRPEGLLSGQSPPPETEATSPSVLRRALVVTRKVATPRCRWAMNNLI